MFYDHKWSQLEDHEKEIIKKHYNYNNAKQKWQEAKAATGEYKAHHSAYNNSGSTNNSTPIPGGFTFDTGSDNVGLTVPTTSTPTVTTTKPTTTSTDGGDVPGTEMHFDQKWSELDKEEKGPIKDYFGDDAKQKWQDMKHGTDEGKNGSDGSGFTFEYQGPAEIPKGGDKVPDGAYGPDIPDDYELPTGAESQYTGPKGGTNPGGGQGPTYITTGGTPGTAAGGSATIAEGAIQINLGDMMSGGGGEQTEVGYLGGGGAGLSKFDPGAFMGGLQASLPTWKGGGKAQATGMFNSRMNLGRN